MSLQLTAKLAARKLDVELEIGDGERVAIIGPNGSGKSTLLSILAGTLRPDSGRAVLDGRVLFDLDAPRRVWLPPHQRGISLLAQDALLFPHLSVLDNVAFGPQVTGASKQSARDSAAWWLNEVGVAEFAARRPSQLSGGQAQRVAIARALASEPHLLMLDEPMAALDVAVAPALRRVLGRVLHSRAVMTVTHDLLDALLLSERVIVLDGGKVAETGLTDEVLKHPRTRFTARIAGLNLIRGVAEDGGIREPAGTIIEGGEHEEVVEGRPAAAVFSPSAVSIFTDESQGSPRNHIRVTIAELEPLGDLVRVRAEDQRGRLLTADVTPRSVSKLDLYPGREVWYVIKAVAVTIYPT
jgi:molybdate transport system ATP-binding protein